MKEEEVAKTARRREKERGPNASLRGENDKVLSFS